MSSTETRVTTEIADGVATVTINRPEAKNALTKSMYAAIREAFQSADKNPEVDVIVIQGSNGSFASGGDLKEILDVLESDRPTDILDYEEYLPFEAVRTTNKPTVARIEGLCIGGGVTLALMCDIVVATDRSRFAIPEAKVGIIDGHMPRLLREAIPPARLRYWMYTGVLFPAAEAYEVGMLTKVVPAEEMDATIAKITGELKASSIPTIGGLKKILIETRTLSPMTDANLSMLQPEALKKLQAFKKK